MSTSRWPVDTLATLGLGAVTVLLLARADVRPPGEPPRDRGGELCPETLDRHSCDYARAVPKSTQLALAQVTVGLKRRGPTGGEAECLPGTRRRAASAVAEWSRGLTGSGQQ
ncbi:hypothetical protein Aglo03_08690 [Actinokineospora globicatena]|uniref:Uncharacterized protein n=1 Tax=Actinokineospora globicatena TaxID=103729 RepID=A0A9W6QGK6_9PSEU|nr:hypothetical protein Aglo03_08690 [Actinokineospora globicatena]